MVGSWTCDLCAYLSSLLHTSGGGAPGKGGLAVALDKGWPGGAPGKGIGKAPDKGGPDYA